MNDTTPTEAECWYSVEYERNNEKREWNTCALVFQAGQKQIFTEYEPVARERLTSNKFASTKRRRLLKHYIQNGTLITEVVEVWYNPNYREP